MKIGVPKEIKDNEYRVAIVPSGVRALTDAGHTVLVESGAGAGSSIADREFERAGAEIIPSPGEVFAGADVVFKVKEPMPAEYPYFRSGLVIFTFFHLASGRGLAQELLEKNVTAIAYETLELEDGTLPALTPMSEVAGRLSVQAGAHYLMKAYGGEGVLLGGVPGVRRGNVTIIGAGVVGANAAKAALGLGAEVTALDTSAGRLRTLDDLHAGRINTLVSNAHNVEDSLEKTDLLIGAVHIPGARTPRVVTREMLGLMKKGSVIVDVSVDQGGCIETTRPTTHTDPVYEVEGVLHYCVTNMPGAVPMTSTYALTNATLPYMLKLANLGLRQAVEKDPAMMKAVNIHNGAVTNARLAESLGMKAKKMMF